MARYVTKKNTGKRYRVRKDSQGREYYTLEKSRGKTTYGKPFRKKNSKGKFRKGTMIRYKYVNGRRVGAVKSRK